MLARVRSAPPAYEPLLRLTPAVKKLRSATKLRSRVSDASTGRQTNSALARYSDTRRHHGMCSAGMYQDKDQGNHHGSFLFSVPHCAGHRFCNSSLPRAPQYLWIAAFSHTYNYISSFEATRSPVGPVASAAASSAPWPSSRRPPFC